jgi:hypothetical protein
MDRIEWSVVSGQWSVVSGQWSVVSGQWSGANGKAEKNLKGNAEA